MRLEKFVHLSWRHIDTAEGHINLEKVWNVENPINSGDADNKSYIDQIKQETIPFVTNETSKGRK